MNAPPSAITSTLCAHGSPLTRGRAYVIVINIVVSAADPDAVRLRRLPSSGRAALRCHFARSHEYNTQATGPEDSGFVQLIGIRHSAARRMRSCSLGGAMTTYTDWMWDKTQ